MKPRQLTPSGTLRFTSRTRFYHTVPKRDGPFPLVIGLHGYGGRAESILQALSAAGRDWVIAAPNAPSPFLPGFPKGETGYSWLTAEERETWLPVALEIVLALREKAIADWPVDPDQVYVVGMSQGGALALECGISYPELFQGSAALSAFLMQNPDRIPLPPWSGSGRFLVTIGEEDQTVLPAQTMKGVEYLIEQGYPVTVRRFRKGHILKLEEIRVLGDWIAGKIAEGAP